MEIGNLLFNFFKLILFLEKFFYLDYGMIWDSFMYFVNVI